MSVQNPVRALPICPLCKKTATRVYKDKDAWIYLHPRRPFKRQNNWNDGGQAIGNTKCEYRP